MFASKNEPRGTRALEGPQSSRAVNLDFKTWSSKARERLHNVGRFHFVPARKILEFSEKQFYEYKTNLSAPNNPILRVSDWILNNTASES